MPKRRTNTIATMSAAAGQIIGGSGSGLTENTIDNLVQRVNRRLQDEIIVEGYSRTRGRNEEISVNYDSENDNFNVTSEGGGSHTVDITERSCTCGQFQYRGESCRHIEAVDEALGQVRNEMPELSDEAVLGTRIAQDARDELERNRQGEETDDGFFYTDNTDEFERTYNNISDELVPYEYENVLNGNTSTFGVELEFVGGDADAIARDLHDLGIVSSPYRLGYHARAEEGKWKVERDGSVSDMYGGGEIVSPILKDTPETWRQIETICEVAKRHGARVDQRCGGHVHIGMNKLDTARQRWRRFFKTIENYEECLFRVAGGDLGRIRSNASSYAIPFAERAAETRNMQFEVEGERDVQNLASRVSRMNRYYGINLENIATRRAPTVEFRHFNGSLNPKQIQANVKLSAGIINAAEKARFRDTEDENYKKRGAILKTTTRVTGTRTKEKMMELLDVAFTRKKDKDALINVFKKNTWR